MTFTYTQRIHITYNEDFEHFFTTISTQSPRT